MDDAGSRSDARSLPVAERGRQLSVWIPRDLFWIFDRLDEATLAAGERGVQLSRNDVVRAVLIRGLRREGDGD